MLQSAIGTALDAGSGGSGMSMDAITVVEKGPGVMATGQLTIGGFAAAIAVEAVAIAVEAAAMAV